MKKQFAVFGLGRFGGSLVKEFHELATEVLAVDKDIDKVNDMAQYATAAVQANTIDEMTLKNLGIRNFDLVFVSFGDDIEASILTSLLLKDMGVKQVWAKAQNSYHEKVLDKIGVDRIINPERDMAKRIAHHIVSEKILDYIELSKEYGIVEIMATEKIHLKTLVELDVRAKYGCNIVAIKRGTDIVVSPMAEDKIFKGDILIVIGKNEDITRFEEEGV
ncbi:potassium transporter Trk [Heyndrickxia shackletonii]|uniref:Potassium transporter Trk n=1 Tax=Heyndrickxia shackletonii TaxID=157838 RepID=A0A0Q3TG61_9BACI|nr:TrkA family potassium uptake protein [Heyndrickxia shackletonii]KQL53040.1 potassium transporter Trk [Heyndrickxia shackletonii]MBB2482043.1 TrkA family potassium uptake protein [Bacillus sp. APMAM]NEY98594.1 TrkA family potassium uptake protein [Heyndrickxia shackletonii]RTZ54629.1 TrkA family potassium uptake protein [Bacillus sp. SAJ1]